MKTFHLHKNHHAQAFTLIELTISLVIIALLLGGVLAGRELITGAEIRSLIKQKQGIEAAANAFKLKFHCTPGDCRTATTYGFSENGNGDGVVNDVTATATSTSTTEMFNFWNHLSEARFISGIYKPAATSGKVTGTDTPSVKLRARAQSGFNVWCENAATSSLSRAYSDWEGPNWLVLGTNMLGGGTSNINLGAITPAIAYSIDLKVDDGAAITGNVRGYGATPDISLGTFCYQDPYTSLVAATSTTSKYCLSNSLSPVNYNVTGTEQRCALIFAVSY